MEHEDQKQQTQKEMDRAEVEEVKEVTENADAKMHQHEEREGAEQPVTKRDRTLNQNTSDEVWPPKKVNKCSLLSPDTRSGLDLVDRGADTAAGLGVSPTTGHGASTSLLSPERRSTARTERRSTEKKVSSCNSKSA